MDADLSEHLKLIRKNTTDVLTDYFNKVEFPANGIFVLGCSTSEIEGKWMGTDPNLHIGEVVVDTIQSFLLPRHIHLAIQGCQHLNRALLVERKVAKEHDLEIVSVVPSVLAGGSTQLAAYQKKHDPVEVEHITAFGGLDIGGTEIGMHVKFVQIPVKIKQAKIGKANVVCLKSRPKLIGGPRAQYEFSQDVFAK